MKIKRSKDCGNSPKNIQVENLFIYIVDNDRRNIDPYVNRKLTITFPNGQTLTENLDKLRFFEFTTSKTSTLEILSIASHGKVGAVNGMVQLTKKERRYVSAFFEFTSVSAKLLAKMHLYQSTSVDPF